MKPKLRRLCLTSWYAIMTEPLRVIHTAVPLNWNLCCQLVLKAKGTSAYAKAYAEAGLRMVEGGDLVRVQAMYLLSNISHWRGERSKDVRAYLKPLSKRRSK